MESRYKFSGIYFFAATADRKVVKYMNEWYLWSTFVSGIIVYV